MTREERRREANRLYRKGKGLTIRAIAELLGVSPGTVHRDVNPAARERYRKSWRKNWGAQSGNRRNVTTTERRLK